MDEKSDLEVYFRLNETERRIVQTAARMGDTSGGRSVFRALLSEADPGEIADSKAGDCGLERLA